MDIVWNRSLLLVLALPLATVACGAAPDDEDTEAEDLDEQVSAATYAYGTVFDTGGIRLKVRSKPSVSSSQIDSLYEGEQVGIACQTTGDWVDNTNLWNKLSSGGYVSDRFLLTGYDGFIPGVPKCGGSGGSGGGGGSSGGSVAAKAIAEARKHVGYQESWPNCNKFSNYWGTGCVEWCSDFVRHAWAKAGAATGGLSSYSMDFRDYGLSHGTWKPNVAGVVIEPGDAVIWGASDYSWGAHVAMVTEVSGSSIRIIHGNFDIQLNGTGDDAVFETGWTNRWDTAGTGYNIVGFVSPD